MQYLAAILLLALSTNAHAQLVEGKISALLLEAKHFDGLSDWQRVIHAEAQTEMDLEKAKVHFENGKILREKNAISEAELRDREHAFRRNEEGLREARARSKVYSLQMELNDVRLRGVENPQPGIGVAVAVKLRALYDAQVDLAELALARAKVCEDYHRRKLDEAEELYRKKVWTELKLREVRLNFESARLESEAMRAQIATWKNAKVAVEVRLAHMSEI